MATLRTILNNVLVILGEDEIGSGVSELTETYHLILLKFFNQIKRQVEDAHNWRELVFQFYMYNTSAQSVPIYGSNERCRVVRVYDEITGEEKALVFDVTDTNNPYRLYEMDRSELLRRIRLDTSNGDDPVHFSIGNNIGTYSYDYDGLSIGLPIASDTSLHLTVYPAPTDQRDYRMYLVKPQDDFAADDLDTIVLTPANPLEVGTLWYALEDRGEELGTNGLFNQEMFDQALGAAIGRDNAEQGEYNLVPV